MVGGERSGETPQKCSPQKELRLVSVAFGVCDDLRQAGIPVVYAGSSFGGLSKGASGAIAFHAPYEDESAGVYVKWNPSPEMMRQVIRPEGPDLRVIALGSTATEVMRAALRSILEAAGWDVSDYLNSPSGEVYLRVVAKLSAG